MSIRDQHREAMTLMDQAHGALRRAYRLERGCADSLEAKPENEPTRAILYRSAGWIAMQRGWYHIAIECADEGLSNVLSPEIQGELEELKAEAERRRTIMPTVDVKADYLPTEAS